MTDPLRVALEELIEAFGGHGSHWDYTMQHGAGCEQCHRERAAREKARAALLLAAQAVPVDDLGSYRCWHCERPASLLVGYCSEHPVPPAPKESKT